LSKNSEIEEEIGEASSEADDEAEEAEQIFKCLPEIGRPGRVLAQAYKVSHLTYDLTPKENHTYGFVGLREHHTYGFHLARVA
jgi:hypothetical protein